ncbi:hypothetical protein V6C42_00315 [Pseudoclostridium thermosuccinogenes]
MTAYSVAPAWPIYLCFNEQPVSSLMQLKLLLKAWTHHRKGGISSTIL